MQYTKVCHKYETQTMMVFMGARHKNRMQHSTFTKSLEHLNIYNHIHWFEPVSVHCTHCLSELLPSACHALTVSQIKPAKQKLPVRRRICPEWLASQLDFGILRNHYITRRPSQTRGIWRSLIGSWSRCKFATGPSFKGSLELVKFTSKSLLLCTHDQD